MAECVMIKIKSSLSVAATIDEPSNSQGQLPCVILVHGNTGWKEEEHIATLAGKLAAEGVLAVRFDAPGSGESEGTWEKDYRVTNFIEVVDDVFDFVLKNYKVDERRVGIWGHSMGGLVAVQAAARHPKRFAAFCGCELSSGLMSKAHATFGDTVTGDVKMETENFGIITLPRAYFDDRAQYSTLDTVETLRMPKLFIAGTNDEIVPASDVRSIFDRAHEPKEFAEFPTDHMYKNDPKNLRPINDRTVMFFKTALQLKSTV